MGDYFEPEPGKEISLGEMMQQASRGEDTEDGSLDTYSLIYGDKEPEQFQGQAYESSAYSSQTTQEALSYVEEKSHKKESPIKDLGEFAKINKKISKSVEEIIKENVGKLDGLGVNLRESPSGDLNTFLKNSRYEELSAEERLSLFSFLSMRFLAGTLYTLTNKLGEADTASVDEICDQIYNGILGEWYGVPHEAKTVEVVKEVEVPVEVIKEVIKEVKVPVEVVREVEVPVEKETASKESMRAVLMILSRIQGREGEAERLAVSNGLPVGMDLVDLALALYEKGVKVRSKLTQEIAEMGREERIIKTVRMSEQELIEIALDLNISTNTEDKYLLAFEIDQKIEAEKK